MNLKPILFRYLPLFLCSALVLTSCATTRSKPRAQSKKRVKKVKRPVRVKPKIAKPVKPAPRIVKRETLNQLYSRYLDETQALNERDRQLVERFTTKQNPTNLEQAAAFVGHLRLVQMQADRSSDFVEQGLSTPNDPNGLPMTDRSNLPKNISLADYFSRRGIDPIEQLRSNPSLNRPAVYQLLAKVMTKTNNHDSFITSARQTFQQAFGQWKALAPSYGLITDSNEAVAAEDGEQTEDAAEENVYHIPSGTSLADFRQAEAQLVEGQMLANNNDYQNAIRYLATIPDGHPFYPTAAEKKRFFTNYAVQQLREQASDSYRQALPVADLSTKKGLLVKAKNTLVMAIKRYPNAEHIDTVRENLEVIERDLKKIQIEQSDANY